MESAINLVTAINVHSGLLSISQAYKENAENAANGITMSVGSASDF
jgi:phosphatidylserine synthase